MTDDNDRERRRVAKEVLGDVDVYTESEGGPNGPWWYLSLRVNRTANNVFVHDPDGHLISMFNISEVSDDPAYRDVMCRLDESHERWVRTL